MGLNVHVVIISSFMLWGSLSVIGKDFVCEENRKVLVSYVCKSPDLEGEFTIPVDIVTNAQYVKLKSDGNSTWLINGPDVWKKLSSLNTLHINTSKSWVISDPASIDKWRNELFAVPKLEILRVTYFLHHNDQLHNWTLTSNLKQLYLENSVMDFDLRTCDNLKSLSLINTSLTNIPENNGLYFMTHLVLKNNTLKNMTVFDLAGFCSLTHIYIADAVIEDCECKKLSKLFAEMKKYPYSEKLSVYYNCNHNSTKNCTKYQWDAAMKKRELCLDVVFSNMILETIYIILGIGAVITIAVCIGVLVLWYL